MSTWSVALWALLACLTLCCANVHAKCDKDIALLDPAKTFSFTTCCKENNPANTIPAGIDRLTALTNIRLMGCQYNGTIPSAWLDFSGLVNLDLTSNKFASIPLGLTRLTQLTSISLRSNLITFIPPALQLPPKLKSFDLKENRIHLPIPEFPYRVVGLPYKKYRAPGQTCGAAPNMECAGGVDACDPKTSRCCGPNAVCSIVPLTCMERYVEHEIEKGTVANRICPCLKQVNQFPSNIVSWTTLENLSFPDCNITGTLPNYLFHMSNLKTIDLSRNQFQGALPSNVSSMTNLEQLNLKSNLKLTGSIPATYTQLPKLKSLDLTSARVHGPLPEFTENVVLTTPRPLYLAPGDSCGLTGSTLCSAGSEVCPRGTLACCDGEGKGNGCEGVTKEVDAVDKLDCLERYIENNSENGGPKKYAGCPCITSSTNAKFPPRNLHKWMNIESLELNNCSLTGKLGNSLFQLPKLQTLSLASNQINGTIPAMVKNLRELVSLDLSSNVFVGTVPSEMTGLSNLRKLKLVGNKIFGPVPEFDAEVEVDIGPLFLPPGAFCLYMPMMCSAGVDMCGTSGLCCRSSDDCADQEAYLGAEEPCLDRFIRTFEQGGPISYTGCPCPNQVNPFPSNFHLWTQTTSLSMTNCGITGPMSNSLFAMTELRELNFSSNKIEGSIPFLFSDLQQLTILSLQDNMITGSVPALLDAMTNLDTIDLRSNRIHGPAPVAPAFATKTLRLTTPLYLAEGDICEGVDRQDQCSAGSDFCDQRTTRRCCGPNGCAGISKPQTCLEAYIEGNSEFGYPLGQSPPGRYFGCPCDTILQAFPRNLYLWNRVTELAITNCGLTGTVPHDVVRMTDLVHLDLSNNTITGSIPDRFTTQLTMLDTLKLDNNLITGTISPAFLELSSLREFSITGNQIEKPVPSLTRVRFTCDAPAIE